MKRLHARLGSFAVSKGVAVVGERDRVDESGELVDATGQLFGEPLDLVLVLHVANEDIIF